MPLALQIAASILKADLTLDAGELFEDLSVQAERLDRLHYDDGSGRHAPSVAAAFGLSCRRLDGTAASSRPRKSAGAIRTLGSRRIRLTFQVSAPVQTSSRSPSSLTTQTGTEAAVSGTPLPGMLAADNYLSGSPACG